MLEETFSNVVLDESRKVRDSTDLGWGVPAPQHQHPMETVQFPVYGRIGRPFIQAFGHIGLQPSGRDGFHSHAAKNPFQVFDVVLAAAPGLPALLLVLTLQIPNQVFEFGLLNGWPSLAPSRTLSSALLRTFSASRFSSLWVLS